MTTTELASERRAFHCRQHQRKRERYADIIRKALGPTATQETLIGAAKLRWGLGNEDAAEVARLAMEGREAIEAETIHLTQEETMDDKAIQDAVRKEIHRYLQADPKPPTEEVYQGLRARTGTAITLATFRSYISRERIRLQAALPKTLPFPVNSRSIAEVDAKEPMTPRIIPETIPPAPKAVLPNPVTQTVSLLKARHDDLTRELLELEAALSYLTRAPLEH